MTLWLCKMIFCPYKLSFCFCSLTFFKCISPFGFCKSPFFKCNSSFFFRWISSPDDASSSICLTARQVQDDNSTYSFQDSAKIVSSTFCGRNQFTQRFYQLPCGRKFRKNKIISLITLL